MMDDWRTRAYAAIKTLEQLLGPQDAEVRRRFAMWQALDQFEPPQYREARFAQLELATRTEAEFLRYALWHPSMRPQILAAQAPADPPPALLVDPATVSQTGQTSQTQAISRPKLDPPPSSAPPTASSPTSAASAASVPPPAAAATATAVAPAPPAPPRRKLALGRNTLSASALYADGLESWNEICEAEKRRDKAAALKAADRLQRVFSELQYFPGDNPSLKALERIVGRTCQEVVDGTLQRRYQ